MKLILTVDIDDTEQHQDAHLDELGEACEGDEVVHIQTNAASIPAVILSVKEA